MSGSARAGFAKRAFGSSRGQPLYESSGLKWLAAGGAATPAVLDASAELIVTSHVDEGRSSVDSARKLGRMLAKMHASGAPWYGAPPSGYSGPGWMGAAPLELVEHEPEKSERSWGRFYSKLRVRPYLNASFDGSERAVIEDLCVLLESGQLDHDEPDLVRSGGHLASRIHGDLWSGNVLWGSQGPVLIDPAAQGGHAEEDLATLRTFGAPYLDKIIEAYQEVSALAPGWEQRTGLHQMHILMVHCYLFGRSYVPKTVAIARGVLAS